MSLSTAPSSSWLPKHLVERYGRFLASAIPWVNRGIAVIPANGKRPCVKFSAYHHKGATPPDMGTISRWGSQFRDANALILVGQGGLVAVDVDDPRELGWCVNEFGETPVKVEMSDAVLDGVLLSYSALWPKLSGGSSVNVLATDFVQRYDRCSAMNSTFVEIL